MLTKRQRQNQSDGYPTSIPHCEGYPSSGRGAFLSMCKMRPTATAQRGTQLLRFPRSASLFMTQTLRRPTKEYHDSHACELTDVDLAAACNDIDLDQDMTKPTTEQ